MTLEQPDAEEFLEMLDLVADRRRCDGKFFRCLRKAAMRAQRGVLNASNAFSGGGSG